MACQETDGADDTVTDLAKAGEMDEETLLEQRTKRRSLNSEGSGLSK